MATLSRLLWDSNNGSFELKQSQVEPFNLTFIIYYCIAQN